MHKDYRQGLFINRVNAMLKLLKEELPTAMKNPKTLRTMQQTLGEEDLQDFAERVRNLAYLDKGGVCCGLLNKWFETIHKGKSSERFFEKFYPEQFEEDINNYTLEEALNRDWINLIKFAQKISILQTNIGKTSHNGDPIQQANLKILFGAEFLSKTQLVVTQSNLEQIIEKFFKPGRFYRLAVPTHNTGMYIDKDNKYILYDPNIGQIPFNNAKELSDFIFKRSFAPILRGKNSISLELHTYYQDQKEIETLNPVKKDLEKVLTYINANKSQDRELANKMGELLNDFFDGQVPLETQGMKIYLLIHQNPSFFDKLASLNELKQFVVSQHQNRDIVSMLADSLPLNAIGTHGVSSLVYAVLSGDTLAAEILLKKSQMLILYIRIIGEMKKLSFTRPRRQNNLGW